jgi:hypothetical protein
MAYIKKGFVTDSYVDEIEHRIYNNIPIKNFLEEIIPPKKINHVSVNKMLKRGEKTTPGGTGFEHVLITSLGRLINGEKIKQYIPKMGVSKLHLYLSVNGSISNSVINLEEVFEKNGWPYSYKKILADYKKYKWNIQKYSTKKL